MLRVGNSYGVGILVLLLANFIVLFWHESGHGLTCKLFGRHIRKAGLMFYYGMPAFFVDASDMWMAERRPRIMVSLAGPAVNVLIGSILAIIVLVLPTSTFRQVLFIARCRLPQCVAEPESFAQVDGYYVLIDLLQQGSCGKIVDFVRKVFSRKSEPPFTREDVMYAIYGVLAIAFGVDSAVRYRHLKRELRRWCSIWRLARTCWRSSGRRPDDCSEHLACRGIAARRGVAGHSRQQRASWKELVAALKQRTLVLTFDRNAEMTR
jgi:hypothetical protein